MSPGPRLAVRTQAALVLRIWYWYVRVRLRLRRGNLAQVVDWLGRVNGVSAHDTAPARLGRIVGKTLAVAGATCLLKSLVLFRLLHGTGADAELVLGLPREASSHGAHAWTEVDGADVGPPPGGAGYTVLARYRAGAPSSASRA